MSRMLQNVLQWQQPSRFQRSPNRWLTWAQRLNQGRDRLPQRHSPLSLTLHQQLPFPLNSPVHSHWQTNTWQFLPQIHLSITPLLRELSHQHQTSWIFQSYSREQTNTVAIASPEVTQRETFPWRNNQTLVPAIHREFLIPQVSREQTISFYETPSPPDSRERNVFRVTPASTQFSPLQQVFHRVQQQTVTHFHANLLTQENPQFVQRITRDRQRIEETRSQTAVVHQGMKQPSEPRGAIAPLAAMPSSIANSSLANHPPGFSAPPPAINLEQLTDQVMRQLDSRLVAQRERMGRTF